MADRIAEFFRRRENPLDTAFKEAQQRNDLDGMMTQISHLAITKSPQHRRRIVAWLEGLDQSIDVQASSVPPPDYSRDQVKSLLTNSVALAKAVVDYPRFPNQQVQDQTIGPIDKAINYAADAVIKYVHSHPEPSNSFLFYAPFRWLYDAMSLANKLSFSSNPKEVFGKVYSRLYYLQYHLDIFNQINTASMSRDFDSLFVLSSCNIQDQVLSDLAHGAAYASLDGLTDFIYEGNPYLRDYSLEHERHAVEYILKVYLMDTKQGQKAVDKLFTAIDQMKYMVSHNGLAKLSDEEIKDLNDSLFLAWHSVVPSCPTEIHSAVVDISGLQNTVETEIIKRTMPPSCPTSPVRPPTPEAAPNNQIIETADNRRFEVIKTFTGGQATVLLVREVSTGQDYRLKYYTDPKLSAEGVTVDRLNETTRAVYQSLAKVGWQDRISEPHGAMLSKTGVRYMISEPINEQSIDQTGQMSEADTARFIHFVAETLNYLIRDTGIGHYDLKPSNLFPHHIDDWDAAKKQSDWGMPVHGTPGYASDSLYQQRPIPLADIYALAGVIYFCLTGDEPEVTQNRFPRINQLSPFWQNLINQCSQAEKTRFCMADVAKSIEDKFPSIRPSPRRPS